MKEDKLIYHNYLNIQIFLQLNTFHDLFLFRQHRLKDYLQTKKIFVIFYCHFIFIDKQGNKKLKKRITEVILSVTVSLKKKKKLYPITGVSAGLQARDQN